MGALPKARHARRTGPGLTTSMQPKTISRLRNVSACFPRNRGGISGIALVFLLAVLLAALFVAGAWPKWNATRTAQAEAARETLPSVMFVPAKRGNGKTDLNLPASIHALQETTIYARTSGYLRNRLVDIGDAVKAGQLLAEIEAPELDRELDQVRAARLQAMANRELSRITAERYASLLKQEAVSSQEADEKQGHYTARQADYVAADAVVRRLEQMKSFQRVVAPFSGTVTARNVEVGSLIQSGSSSAAGWLFKLSHTDTLRVQVSVPQSSMRRVQTGMSVDLVVPELGERVFAAKIVRNAGAFDPASRTMMIEMLVPNQQGPLVPGMYGQARLHLTDEAPALQVPVNALMVSGSGVQLATVDKDDLIHIRNVKIGRDLGKEVEILDGIAEHDRVVSNPRDSLADGMKVRAVEFQAHSDKKEPPKPATGTDAKPKS